MNKLYESQTLQPVEIIENGKILLNYFSFLLKQTETEDDHNALTAKAPKYQKGDSHIPFIETSQK